MDTLLVILQVLGGLFAFIILLILILASVIYMDEAPSSSSKIKLNNLKCAACSTSVDVPEEKAWCYKCGQPMQKYVSAQQLYEVYMNHVAAWYNSNGQVDERLMRIIEERMEIPEGAAVGDFRTNLLAKEAASQMTYTRKVTPYYEGSNKGNSKLLRALSEVVRNKEYLTNQGQVS